MSNDLITQEVLDLCEGVIGAEALRGYAVGKTRSEFAAAMVVLLEVKRAELTAVGDGITNYSIGGDSVTRELRQIDDAITYFRKVGSSTRGGVFFQRGEFVGEW